MILLVISTRERSVINPHGIKEFFSFLKRRRDKETQTDASFHFTLGMDSHPSRGRLARRCTEFISGRAKRIPSTRRLLFLVAPGVDAISSADCWVCILVRLCWAPLHTTCDLTHFTTLHYSSLLFHWGWRLDSWNLLQRTWCQRQSALLGFSRDLGPIAESSGAG